MENTVKKMGDIDVLQRLLDDYQCNRLGKSDQSEGRPLSGTKMYKGTGSGKSNTGDGLFSPTMKKGGQNMPGNTIQAADEFDSQLMQEIDGKIEALQEAIA